MSDDPQQPDWAIRVFQGARANRPANTDQQWQGLSQTQMDQFTAWNQNVAGKDQLAAGDVPVAGSAVSGTVQTNSVSVAPATSVSVADTNLLVSQNFTSPTTVVSVGQWSWWGDDGHLNLGCARVDCNGLQDDLVSNEVLVVPNENLSVTVWVKWSDLTYAGTTPISLGIERYRKGRDPDTGGTVYMDIGGSDVATLSSPGSSGGWMKLTGTYTVPSKGVDQLRFRFRSTATTGYVLWDEAEFRKTDLIPDAAVPGVGTTVDNVVTNLTGQAGSGFSHADESAALSGAATALTANSATVAQLDAANSTGSIAGDDFAYSGELIASTKWGGNTPQATNHPYFIANGNSAVWDYTDRLGAPVNTEWKSQYDWRGTSPTSSTDYQKVQVVLSSGMNSYSTVSGRLYLYGRISSDWSNYIEAELAASGSYRLTCCVGSVRTTLTSGAWVNNLGSGSVVTLYCGDVNTTAPRTFKLAVNGSNVFTYTDSGTSVYGASYRKWGFGGSGMYTEVPFSGYVWLIAPSVNQWTGTDQ